MRVALVVLAVLVIAPIASARSDAPLLSGIRDARTATFRCEDSLGQRRSPVADQTPRGLGYRGWVLRLWKERAARTCRRASEVSSPEAAIRYVFGGYADQALRVAHCESRYDTRATNGQYLGLFQMGSHERATYGHGSTPLSQAQAAYRYFVASGRDWSPWQCKPWS